MKSEKHKGLLHHLNINVSDVKRSSRFYGPVFRYLGYQLTASHYEGDYAFEDWTRFELDTPHEISICQADTSIASGKHERRAVGRHNHIAFCALDRDDVDRFHAQVLVPLEKEGLCTIEDPPCHCPEYNEGYYATFFFDPDGLKYEYVINPNYFKKRDKWKAKGNSSTNQTNH